MLAQAGEGSVRDSLSALDQAIACCGNKLEAARGARAAGGCFRSIRWTQVTEALAARRVAAGCSTWWTSWSATASNLQHFCRELARYFRNLLVGGSPGATRLVAASPPEQRAGSAEIAGAVFRRGSDALSAAHARSVPGSAELAAAAVASGDRAAAAGAGRAAAADRRGAGGPGRSGDPKPRRGGRNGSGAGTPPPGAARPVAVRAATAPGRLAASREPRPSIHRPARHRSAIWRARLHAALMESACLSPPTRVEHSTVVVTRRRAACSPPRRCISWR